MPYTKEQRSEYQKNRYRNDPVFREKHLECLRRLHAKTKKYNAMIAILSERAPELIAEINSQLTSN
jgi:HPt (histidine-containing phosphotransfer) domain-containing protein